MSRRAEKPISDADERFALEYLANGYNATRAYLSAHPKAKDRTGHVEGGRLLRKPSVAAFIEVEQQARKRRLQMDGDEALEAITRHARADIRRLYGKDSRLLPIAEWPDDAADAVKSVKPGTRGTAITLFDKLKARELMAIAGGKLHVKHDHVHSFDHAKYLGAEPPKGDDAS